MSERTAKKKGIEVKELVEETKKMGGEVGEELWQNVVFFVTLSHKGIGQTERWLTTNNKINTKRR